jgi:hypothetical protein
MFEKENLAYGYEFWFTFLGIGFIIRYNTDKSFELFDEMDEEVQQALEEDSAMTFEEFKKMWHEG